MQSVKADYRVGVFGHYGHDNMGDEAIIEAVIQNLRARCPMVQLTGFSMNAEDTAQRHGIPAFRIRSQTPRKNVDCEASRLANNASVLRPSRVHVARDYLKRLWLLRRLVHAIRFVLNLPREMLREFVFLWRSYRIAGEMDAFIVAGSNQFMDNFGGVWGFPYTLLKWTVLARCAGARVVFLSVGAGPIKSLWSRIMVRASLLLADYVSFRDAGSKQLIEWSGSGGGWRVYPDLAQSLEFTRRPRGGASDRPLVAINPMPVYDKRTWYEPDEDRYERYVGQLARFASRVIRADYPVFFFSTQPSDEPVIDDVLTLLDRDLVVAGVPERKNPSKTVEEIMGVLRSADIIVPTRYHGTVLGLHAGRPVLGICYYCKTREVLEARGQEAYAVDIDAMDDAGLWHRFETLVANRHEEIRKIEQKGTEVGALLAEQYDAVLGILRVPVAATASP